MLFYTKRPTFPFNSVKTNESKNLKKFKLNLYCIKSQVISSHAKIDEILRVRAHQKSAFKR